MSHSNLPQTDHVIEISEDVDNDRSYWMCDCGCAGSCDSYNLDIVAEKHIPAGEHVIYRHRGGAS